MCRKIEVGLVELKIGDSKHYLCYPCMATFATDVKMYADGNLYPTVDSYGNTVYSEKKEE